MLGPRACRGGCLGPVLCPAGVMTTAGSPECKHELPTLDTRSENRHGKGWKRRCEGTAGDQVVGTRGAAWRRGLAPGGGLGWGSASDLQDHPMFVSRL